MCNTWGMTDFSEKLIISRVENGTGVLELNRPRALNSLNPEMIDVIDECLRAWADDDAVSQVIVYSNSPKGFCAGGDVRYARDAVQNGTPELADKFFADEYKMNGDLHHFSKPYIALIDGVAMGGGLGISVHGSHRVVSEKAFAAMPEMAIAYIPDVGVPFMLQRMVGGKGYTSPALALFLVTTGWRLSPADMLWSGVATDFVASENMESLRQAIIEKGIDAALSDYSTEVAEESELAKWIDDIEATFVHGSWPQVLDAVKNHENESFANMVYEHIAASSPSALVAATELMAVAAECADIREELECERKLGEVIRIEPDFVEGVRAVLVDKTRDASWNPPTVESVDPKKYRAIVRG